MTSQKCGGKIMFNLVTSSTLRRRKGDLQHGDIKMGQKNVFIKRTYNALYYRVYAKTFKKLENMSTYIY